MKGVRSIYSLLATALISAFFVFSMSAISAEPKGSVETTVGQKVQTQKAPVGGVINLNKADVQTLAELNGVGEKKAEAIIAYRQANGGFKSVDDLLNVKGIGEKTLEKNRSRLSIN